MSWANAIEGHAPRWLLEMGCFLIADIEALPVDNSFLASLIDGGGGWGLLNGRVAGGDVIYDRIGKNSCGTKKHSRQQYNCHPAMVNNTLLTSPDQQFHHLLFEHAMLSSQRIYKDFLIVIL